MLVADGVAGSPLLAVPSGVAGVAAADVAGVTAGSSTRALVWSGVGIALGICDAPAAAADAEPLNGPTHVVPVLLRCALSTGGPLLPSGAPDVSVGVGSDDPVGGVGVWVGEAGSVVGVAAGELWAGATVGLTA